MRLLTFYHRDKERLGAIKVGRVVDLHEVYLALRSRLQVDILSISQQPYPRDMLSFLRAGPDVWKLTGELLSLVDEMEYASPGGGLSFDELRGRDRSSCPLPRQDRLCGPQLR